MKKALKRLNGKTIRSVAENRAVIEDDGEIVSRRINQRNKGDTDNSNVDADKNTRKCCIKLHRSRMRQEDGSNQSESSQTNEKSFATGEQNIKTNIPLKDKRKGTQLVSANKPDKISGRVTKSKILLRRVNSRANELVNKVKIVPSILEPFVKSPEGIITTSKQDKTVEIRHRLSLSRKKLANKNNTLQSGSSLEQSSSDNNENSNSKDADSIHSSKLHNEETTTNSNIINDNDILEKKNEEQQSTVPKTPKCLIKVRRIQLPNASENKEKATRGRRGRKKLATSPKPTSKPQTTPPMIEQPQIPHGACKSPDIFSDADPGRESDIYAFHTQSSQSEHEDIAADIIEKMKKEGKIKLVKPKHQHDRKNNTMRPANWLDVRKNVTLSETTVKRRVGRPRKKELKEQNKTTSAIDGTTKRKVGLRKKKVGLKEKNQIAPVIDADDHDHDDHFDVALNTAEEREAEPRVEAIKPINGKSDGFSTLAQKVLRKQTAIMSPGKPPVPTQNNTFDKLKLLQIAKKIVRSSNVSHSTPNKPTLGSVTNGVRPTPASPSNRASPSGGASPWRVDSENIPRLFYFSRTSDNLPSYSSDVIPSSQPTNDSARRKDASKNSTAVSPSRILSDSLNISAIQDISPIKSHNNSSLNISNIENISPVKPLAEKFKENSIILNPNPRRGLAERSPLKPINILNVVSLPNRVNVNQATDSIKPSRGNKENVTVKPNRIQNLNKSNNATLNNNTLKDSSIASDFFGFSDNENIDQDEDLQPVPKSKLPSKKRLHHKLIKLKRLLPPKPTRVSYGTIRSIFNSPKKQKDIREMLSSTRAKPGNDTNVTETSIILDDESSNDEMSSIAQNEENSTIADEDLHLFGDLEPQPQLSFNASMKIRTYQRPKRKAKRVRSFILFHSDSENEDESPPTKPKRTKPDKNKKELTKFVSEFNSMCEEVDQYELVVEKDKSG